MFYVASKLLIGLLHPFHWIVLLLLVSFLVKTGRAKRWFRWGALVLFILFANRGLINLVYKWMEPAPFSQDKISTPYPYGVLLGGGFARFNPDLPDRILFRDHVNRLTESMELFQSGKIKRLILSGGDGTLATKKEIESLNIRTFLVENNWPDSSILVESTSRNTFENARNVKYILDSLQVNDPVLLITSAMHMARAKGCFDKQGIPTVEYPADYRQRSHCGWSEFLFPDISCLDEWQAILKEWIGMLAYRIKGYV